MTIRISQIDISRETIQSLGEQSDKPSISLYMPAKISGRETQQNTIRFRNLIDEAATIVSNHPQFAEQAGELKRELLDPAQQAIDDEKFWRHQSEGLALFLRPDEDVKIYRSPVSFDEGAFVGERFYVVPLTPLLETGGVFYVALASQNEFSLMRCGADGYVEIDMGDVGMGREVVQRFVDAEKQLQHHTTRKQTGTTGGDDAIFHGHGAGDQNDEARIFEYFRAADGVLDEIERNEETPLVFAGVDFLFPIFQRAVRSVDVVDEHIGGNHDRVRANIDKVVEQARDMIRDRRTDPDFDWASQLEGAASREKGSKQLSEIVRAAHQGLVEFLYLLEQSDGRKFEPHWGTFDDATSEATEHNERKPGDIDLVNLAAIFAMQNGGELRCRPASAAQTDGLTSFGPAAAVFRAPISS